MCRDCFNRGSNKKRRENRANDPATKEREYQRNRDYRAKYSDGYRQHRLRKREKHKSAYFSDLHYRCRMMVKICARRAKSKGMAFELTSDIMFAMIMAQNGRCSVTGTPFDLSASEVYLRSPLAPSIDRKNSDGGYTLDNVQIVVSWYNLLKNEWSDNDVKTFIATAYHTMFGD